MHNPNLTINEGILELLPIAEEKGLRLIGHIFATVKRAITGIEETVIDQSNTIEVDLKEAMRDTMHSNTDFALDNLQATQVAQASLSAALNGKDGICVANINPGSIIISTLLAFMASAVHPSDPSGNYYRQWQGVYQNLTGSTETAKSAVMGQGYTHVTTDNPFLAGVRFTNSYFADVTLLNNDIITINWKITVG